jgi:hypothetical protein
LRDELERANQEYAKQWAIDRQTLYKQNLFSPFLTQTNVSVNAFLTESLAKRVSGKILPKRVFTKLGANLLYPNKHKSLP